MDIVLDGYIENRSITPGHEWLVKQLSIASPVSSCVLEHQRRRERQRAGLLEMVSAVQPQIGDLVEFSLRPDDPLSAMSHGRVMDVDAVAPLKCALQVSPFEPLRQIDLSQSRFKIVYEVGEFTTLTPDMVGWEVEILVDGQESQPMNECGVIKQVDCGLNCALVAFANGHKDWRDLSMNAFKLHSEVPSASRRSSPTKAASINAQNTNVPRLQLATASFVHANQAPLPTWEACEFEWYTEGGHVELCDSDGRFREGALLCALRDDTLQLFNEKRQFFEVPILQQSFKVIIHGLVTLKSIPLGQAVEIYSPMHAEFRRGRVLKSAEVGKLTPVRIEDIGLEWLDLTSQTFKLVFVASTKTTGKHHEAEDNRPRSSQRDTEAIPTFGTKKTRSDDLPQPSASASPQRHHHEKTKHHSHKTLPQPLPVLDVNHTIELLEPATKQFIKYRVVRVYAEEPHRYDLELSSSSSSSGSLVLMRATEVLKQLTVDLTAVKGRIQLLVDDWHVYEPILRGYRVDVYDRAERSVLNGKILDAEDDSSTGPRVFVKLKDGSKRWFDVKHTKIKLKLHGAGTTMAPGSEDSYPSSGVHPLSPDSMWQRVDPSTAEPDIATEHCKPAALTRRQSERSQQELQESPSPLTRNASTPQMPSSLTRIPSLDLRSVTQEHASSVLLTTESMDVEASNESERSRGSTGEALSDLLPAMDDVWSEEPLHTGGIVVSRYVHAGTGEVSNEIPQWLKQTDGETGEVFILNTTTGVRFQAPGSSTGSRTSPQSSGRAVVVTLPIGPIEAARVASQMNASVFGP